MPKDYFHAGEYRLAGELKKLRGLPEPNRSYALGYKKYMEANDRKALTLYRRLSELRFLLELVGKRDAKLLTRPEIEEIVRHVNKTKRKTSQGEKSDVDMAETTKGKIKDEGNRKLPEEMLSEEEIARLIDACRNQRDKTLIALLWDTGMRVGELLALRIKDVSLEKEGISHIMIPQVKSGMRRCPITLSVPYLVSYLENMRKNAKPEEPLFVVLHNGIASNTQIDYPHIRKLLGDLKVRANLTKRLYPHLFRHSRATFYANRLTEQQAKVYFGWTRDSSMMAKYVHLSGRDIDDAVMKVNGIESKEVEMPRPQIKKCPKCHEINELTAHNCKNCGSLLDIIEQMKELDRGLPDQVEKLQKELSEFKAAFNALMEGLPIGLRKKVRKGEKLVLHKNTRSKLLNCPLSRR
jgi:integrase